jgi:TDG/mug DNA glycosylase family protein
LRTIIEAIQPSVLAFNGKKPAIEFLRIPAGKLAYGCQPARIGRTAIYVLPSTSGAARAYWSIGPWQEMSNIL